MSVASGKKVELAGFLDTGLDLSTDSITEAERERTLAWYREHHDHGRCRRTRYRQLEDGAG